MSVLAFYFGWPLGAVWSNLLASAICAVLIWWRVKARMIAHHVEQIAQKERHHAEQLALAAIRHAELKAHVTAVAAAPRPAPRRAKTLLTEPPKGAGP